jgi:hypothetical protein
MIWLLPTPSPASHSSVRWTGDTQEDWERETNCCRKRWERSQTIRQRERLVLCKSFNILWFLCYVTNCRSRPLCSIRQLLTSAANKYTSIRIDNTYSYLVIYSWIVHGTYVELIKRQKLRDMDPWVWIWGDIVFHLPLHRQAMCSLVKDQKVLLIVSQLARITEKSRNLSNRKSEGAVHLPCMQHMLFF